MTREPGVLPTSTWETAPIQPSERESRRDKRRGLVSLGLIGAGAVWERRYRPVLSRMAQRLTVRAVYDPVPARAQLAAAEWNASLASGLRQLIERSDIHGVLILDPDWMGLVPAELACAAGKPAFLAGSLGDDLDAIRALHHRAHDVNVLLMTEFSRRHTPATIRLRELMATRLGSVRRISIRAPLPRREALPGERVHTDFLLGLLDWCVYLTGRIPSFVSAQPLGPCAAEQSGWKVQLGFRRGGQEQWVATADIHVLPPAEGPAAGNHVVHEVECEHGFASTSQPTEIIWGNADVGRAVESLVADRSEAEVLLDKFCRRLLGGLVPTADVLDVCRGLALARAVEASLRSGHPAEGPWDGV